MMKCWAFFLLVVVWARRGEAVRCNEAAKCAQGLMSSNVEEDRAKACGAMYFTIECLKGAVEDCRISQNVPDSALDGMNRQISHVEDLYHQNCPENKGGQMSRGVSDVRSSVIVLFVVILLAAIFP